MEIALKNAIVRYSAEDHALVSAHCWRLLSSGNKRYARTTINGKDFGMHRLILGCVGDQLVDHIDGDGLNNQRQNLRIATALTNRWNSKPNSLSRFKGVAKSGRGWVTKFVSSARYIYGGCWKTPIEAALAYNDIVRAERGDFALLNDVSVAAALPILQERLVELDTEKARIQRWIEECT